MNEIKEAISYFESLLRCFEDNENDAHWRRKHNQMSREMINCALTALRAQLEPDGWISVENQLPDAKGHYLTIGKINWAHGGSGEGNDGDARRNMIISYFDSTGMFNHPHTTHWRPLPEPPREGKI